MKLPTERLAREELVQQAATALEGLYSGAAVPSPIAGGRREALRRLQTFEPMLYDRARNHLFRRGVSALSPFLRHGMLSLAEVRDYVLTRFNAGNSGVAKFVNELGWRAFYQLVYRDLGRGIEQDVEPPTHGQRHERGLPADVAEGRTALACIDAGLAELFDHGYMHNHARMWFASYLQHHRRVDWRDGAELLYRHLLDGDPASNNLSWQWVGSTFSHKPYIFNKDNVWKFTDGRYCDGCPSADTCPFDDTYEGLSQRLFGRSQHEVERGARPQRGRS